MFVPRALRLKGTKEPVRKSKEAQKAQRELTASKNDVENDISAPQGTSTSHHPSQAGHIGLKKAFSGPRFTVPAITPEFLDKLVCGIELLFTDYAHQDEDGSRWLEKHYRVVDGKEKFVHLSAILVHQNISNLKPQATQILLRRAIEEQGSTTLELAKNGYFVRRRPSTYPLRFVPQNSFSIVDDNGLSFWDQRTIYVEPHIRGFCKTPARVAHWLKTHGHMKDKWFPIQAVHTLFNSCAFVVLSGNVTHEDIWQKWRELDKPECWKIMTKVEHSKRTNEYLALLKQAKPYLTTRGVEAMPVIEPPEPTADCSTINDSPASVTATKKKRKRRSKKGGNKPGTDITNETETLDDEGGNVEAEGLDHEPSGKRSKLSE